MRPRGFTLLELLVVTALLATMAGLLIPRLVFRQSDVVLARAELQGLVRYLRAEAAATGKRHRLRIDREAMTCVPEILEEDRFEPIDDPLARPRRLPVDRILEVLTAAGQSPGPQIELSGFVEPALIEVQVGEEVHTLGVHALTGKVESRPGRAKER